MSLCSLMRNYRIGKREGSMNENHNTKGSKIWSKEFKSSKWIKKSPIKPWMIQSNPISFLKPDNNTKKIRTRTNCKWKTSLTKNYRNSMPTTSLPVDLSFKRLSTMRKGFANNILKQETILLFWIVLDRKLRWSLRKTNKNQKK